MAAIRHIIHTQSFKNRLVCIKDSAERGCGILGYFGYAAKKILMRVICEYEIEREFICLLHVERKEDNKITVSVDMQVVSWLNKIGAERNLRSTIINHLNK